MDQSAWESLGRVVRWLVAWVVAVVLLVHFANHGLVVGRGASVVIHGLFQRLTRAIPLNGS